MALSKWDIIYAFILILYIGSGLFVRRLSKPAAKKKCTAVIGFLTLAICCGKEIIFSLVVISGTIGIIKLKIKNFQYITFVFVFSNLALFRWANYAGVLQSYPVCNAFHLLLTLRLVSVAFEIRDFHARLSDEITEQRFQLMLEEEPTSFDIWCYAYCYIGSFVGPFFKYRTFHDFLHQTAAEQEKYPLEQPLHEHGLKITFFLGGSMLAASIFSIDYSKTEEFYERLLFMIPVFFVNRLRFYLAWLLAECSCITSGLGAYPVYSEPKPGHGPTIDPKACGDQDTTALRYSFETIKNIDPYVCDFCPTIRGGMRHWNMTVQWWLVNFVHKRVPKHMIQFRVAAVMLVSAYWHGTHPGYFAAFLTMPLFMAAEDLMINAIRRKANKGGIGEKLFDLWNWFFKMRAFEYMFMAFMLLTFNHTYRYWSSIYFSGHLFALATIGVFTTFKRFTRMSRLEKAKGN